MCVPISSHLILENCSFYVLHEICFKDTSIWEIRAKWKLRKAGAEDQNENFNRRIEVLSEIESLESLEAGS